jgi:HEAT repeat protein
MAVELLGEVRANGAKEKLLQILADKDDTARGTAARSLGRLGDLTAEPPLTALIQDATISDDLKLDAAEGLLLLGTDSARERVKATRLVDPDAAAELVAMIREYEEPQLRTQKGPA